uniref:aldehyde oxygenase (deformylating) n=1 Tax=Musa acuminata subsp. malaccensis TaxID=214687 RepID=A0A804K834_MUSAM
MLFAMAFADEVLYTFFTIVVYWQGIHPIVRSIGSNSFVSTVSLMMFSLSINILQITSGINIPQPSPVVIAAQFLAGMLVLDTWQCFMQTYMHANKSVYKHVQSKHHTLVVPYAFGARYNHPLEDLLLDTVGGALAFFVSGMTPRTGFFFFSFATTVDDHCGLWLPDNLLHAFFSNNSADYDVHHQLNGSKYNFSQPFFVMWDRIMRTYMPCSLETRKEGRVRSRADQTQELMDPSISCV